MDEVFPSAETISNLCLKKFRSLPKSGNPTSLEWTVLSGIVCFNNLTKESKVVALGAGTKCIGPSKFCRNGFVLNDSHAEVLARRGFIRYIYDELSNEGNLFSFNKDNNCFKLKDCISFHFFSTQTPCGDACIVEEECSPSKKSRIEYTMEAREAKVNKNLGDIVYTGAKLINNEIPDAMCQIIGAVRTKPGRGEKTFSLSCSDKLSRWNILGIQGALLYSVLEAPIYLKTLTFCCDFNDNAIKRAIYQRWNHVLLKSEKFRMGTPIIQGTNEIKFDFRQRANRKPWSNGLVWCDISEKLKPYEVSVNGKRQGCTKKDFHTKSSALKISKYFLMEQYSELLRIRPELMSRFGITPTDIQEKKYSDLKMIAIGYQNAWEKVKHFVFQQWSQKPSGFLDFTLLK